MPGKGRIISRDYTPDEMAAIEAGAGAQGLTSKQALACLGHTTNDVFLNETAYWGNVPENVWGYTVGGYEVIKKWLPYREASLLARPLTKEEVREVTEIARRIAAILLLAPALDANYKACRESAYL